MELLIPMIGVMIPIVAIVGGLGYAAFGKWTENQERQMAMQAADGNVGLQQRVQRLEDEVAVLRSELSHRMDDMDERVSRVEILISEVE